MKPISLGYQKQRLNQQQQAQTERRGRLQNEEARYTVILHHPRKKLGMTINEYCLADTVHKLSSTRSMVPGWCYGDFGKIGPADTERDSAASHALQAARM